MRINLKILGTLFLTSYLLGCAPEEYRLYLSRKKSESCPKQSIPSLEKSSLEKAVADIKIPVVTPENDFKIEYAICAYSSRPRDSELLVLRNGEEIDLFLSGIGYDALEIRVQEDLKNGDTKALVTIYKQKTSGNREIALMLLDPMEFPPDKNRDFIVGIGEWRLDKLEIIMDYIFANRYEKYKSGNKMEI